jgi:hypothetical protein
MMTSKTTATPDCLGAGLRHFAGGLLQEEPNSLGRPWCLIGLGGVGAGSELAAGCRGAGLGRRVPDRRWRPGVLPDGPGDTDRRGQGHVAQARRQLAQHQYADVQVQIEGHADERGTREYNLSLSARRATAVRNFLISAKAFRPAASRVVHRVRQGAPGGFV